MSGEIKVSLPLSFSPLLSLTSSLASVGDLNVIVSSSINRGSGSGAASGAFGLRLLPGIVENSDSSGLIGSVLCDGLLPADGLTSTLDLLGFSATRYLSIQSGGGPWFISFSLISTDSISLRGK